jgi:hypothetical protein
MFTVPSYTALNSGNIAKDYTTPTVSIGAITTVASGARTNTTLTVPTGVADGNLMLAAFMITTAITPTLTNWTPLTSYSDTKQFFIYYRFASSEPATYTIAHASATTNLGVINLKPEVGHVLNTPTFSAQLNTATATYTFPSMSGIANAILLGFMANQTTSVATNPDLRMAEQWEVAWSTTGLNYLMTQLLTRTITTGTRIAKGTGTPNTRCVSVLVTQT